MNCPKCKIEMHPDQLNGGVSCDSCNMHIPQGALEIITAQAEFIEALAWLEECRSVYEWAFIRFSAGYSAKIGQYSIDDFRRAQKELVRWRCAKDGAETSYRAATVAVDDARQRLQEIPQ